MAVFYIKQNDRLPVLNATLVDGNGNPVNLTGTAVTLNMRDSANNVKIAGAACTITNAVGGQVSYAWAPGDVNTAGTYSAEFEVAFAGGNETFPNDSNITVVITSELG